ncbi:MAG: LD-carboxypeptidase [Flavobacterium sp.]|uniref:S66 peptidase family protein n=1 Tax=Flavobacterium sp. TaxID=239 RepID=UPI0026181348|nr:LD-carboxypeptidase [Flavobacterium sp.]MDD5150032.1 LD-carboxypeptidase [Flavobacterium sp.]
MRHKILARQERNDSRSMKFTKPPYLKKGDTIMIVAPAGFVADSTELDPGIALAKSWGLEVILGKHVFSKHNHFAGTDEERLGDMQLALDNKNVKAIWCSRGGYGTVRIIDQIDFTAFKKNPKWVIGFSDITTLHTHIHNLGIATIHATMPGGMHSATDEAKQTLYKALFGYDYGFEIPTNPLNKKGDAKGILIGGNLSIINSMVGSDSEINTYGKILFIEDVGEDLYRVDRMMYTLKRSGLLKNLKALIVGDFSYDIAKDTLFGGSHREIILNAVKDYNYPVIFDFPGGHIKDNRTLIFGKEINIEVNESTSKIYYSFLDN